MTTSQRLEATLRAVKEFLRRVSTRLGPLGRPVAGRRWFPLYAVIHHVGRKSGRAYATPIVVRQTATGFMVPLPFDKAQWARNVLAAGEAHLSWNGRDVIVTDPKFVDVGVAGPAFNGFQRRAIKWLGIDRFLSVTRVDAPRMASSGVEQGEGGSQGPNAVGRDRVDDQLDVADPFGGKGA